MKDRENMEKKDVFGLSLEALQDLLVTYGFKKFRAKQVFEWIYKKSVFEFSKMKNISKDDIMLLEENFTILPANIKILKEQISSDKLTRKVLIELPDGNSIETVLMSHDYGFSVCISSQVGCNMGCAFCASGLTGFVRNLTKAEILLQVYYFNQHLLSTGGFVSRVVVMGSGEPLLNFDAVMRALEFLHMETTLNMSYRNMTISTCGIIPGIEKLAIKKLPINLAISLHSARDDMRSELMPINKTYPFLEVIKAADGYAKATGRQVTYEYIMIANKNDTLLDAELLSNALRFKNSSVNLIPANPVEEKGFKRPSTNTVERFLQVLKKNHINATVRREMGKDIDAACGQLRSKFIGKNS
ncbi:MAG: 23S rRNA (adenine(2503)-C(2))-methyltransferase RlmN [Acidaminococcaceae bacterium]